jgi:chromosome segregation ATPase
MSEHPQKKQDFLEVAKHQFAQITAEFEKALDALKDPEHRKQVTSSYLDMLQKGLSRAQESVAKYQEKIAPQSKTDATETTAATDSPAAAAPNALPPDTLTTPQSKPANSETAESS